MTEMQGKEELQIRNVRRGDRKTESERFNAEG